MEQILTDDEFGMDAEDFEAVIHDTNQRRRFILKPVWCDREDCEFHSYPQDGECPCGMYKHHVHCQHGKVTQVG